MRRKTDNLHLAASRPRASRSQSVSAVDTDLAYGDHSPGHSRHRRTDEAELKGLVGKAKGLLVEADCLHYSVTSIIAHLQKNPEAMAAVALTLAEISNVVAKMGPGVLTSLRAGSPAIFALLASPQFLIAAGVGVGVTIVAFGGYKIIKKIKAKKSENSGDEMLEIGADMSRIDTWRRGITEADDDEFLPHSADRRRSMQESRIRDSQREGRSLRAIEAPKSAKTSGSRSSRASSSSKTLRAETDRKDKKGKKESKPSPLRLMFKALT